MKRRFIAAIIVVVFVSFSAPVYAVDVIGDYASRQVAVFAENDTIMIDGISRKLTVRPIVVGGFQLVGLREITSIFGASVLFDEVTREGIAKTPSVEVRIRINSSEAIVNGKKAIMPVSAQVVDGYTMISLRFLAEVFGYSVEWNSEKREPMLVNMLEIPKADSEEGLPVTRPLDNRLTIPLPLQILNLDAIGDHGLVLEYDDAVKKLLQQNSTIQNINDALDRLKEQRQEVYMDTVWPGLGTGTITTPYVEGLRAMSRLDFAAMNAPLQTQLSAAAAELALRNSILEIEKAQMDMLLLEENIRLAKFNLENNLELRFELGLVSELEVREAKRSLEQLQSQRDATRLTIVSGKEGLAQLLGYRANEDVSVDFRATFAVDDISVESLIRGIGKDPTIVMKEREYLQAQYEHETSTSTYDKFVANQRQENISDKWIAMESARRTWEDAKVDMEKNIRSTYNNIKSLEENHKSLRIALDKARDMYATAIVNLEAGLITRYEADMARMGILKAEIDIEKNVHLLDSLRFMIERPYMLSGR